MSELSKQTVVVVGASSGIGLAAARAAASRGADVIMLSRSQSKLDEAAKSIPGGTTRAVAMDAHERRVGLTGRQGAAVTVAIRNTARLRRVADSDSGAGAPPDRLMIQAYSSGHKGCSSRTRRTRGRVDVRRRRGRIVGRRH